MRFVKYFLKNSCNQNIYKLRAEILMTINNFKLIQIDKNTITVNCFSIIGNVAQCVFKDPSYTEIKSCVVCSNIIMRQSVLIPINVDIINKYGYCELSTAILEGMSHNNNSICCKQLLTRNIKYGIQIFIEYDAIGNDLQQEHSLAEFSPKIQISDNSFLLEGTVARYNDTKSGHYVGYSYHQGSEWIEFDDLIKDT